MKYFKANIPYISMRFKDRLAGLDIIEVAGSN